MTSEVDMLTQFTMIPMRVFREYTLVKISEKQILKKPQAYKAGGIPRVTNEQLTEAGITIRAKRLLAFDHRFSGTFSVGDRLLKQMLKYTEHGYDVHYTEFLDKLSYDTPIIRANCTISTTAASSVHPFTTKESRKRVVGAG